MAGTSIHDLGLDHLSVEERLKLADALWDSVERDVQLGALPESQRAELERRLADSIARPEAVKSWESIEAEALARAKR